MTNVLLFARQQLDPTFKVPNPPQNVVATSGAYGVYMSISSNLRYQVRPGLGRLGAAGGRGGAGGWWGGESNAGAVGVFEEEERM